MTIASLDNSTQFVVFSVNQELYSLSIEEVVEILIVPAITSVPGISETIEGVINLRGSIIPVVNLHKCLHHATHTKDRKNRVVIVQGENENIGLIVDEVKMVTNFDDKNVEPPPGLKQGKASFIGFAKLEGQVIGILNPKKILYDRQTR